MPIPRPCITSWPTRPWSIDDLRTMRLRLPRLIGLSRALDLILTGRPVDAQEALALGLGLANRVVPRGQARAAAEALAAELARLPQACLRSDRRSAYEARDLDLEAALANEFRLGMGSLTAEGLAGAARFAQGAGRRGEADSGTAD